jgi:3-oxoacyl-[acyl-carrier-protein] synthase-3
MSTTANGKPANGQPVYLYGPRYVLGEIESPYTSIAGLPERAAQLRLQLDPNLWGWGTFHRTECELEQLAVDAGNASLRAAGLDPSSIDALFVCSTRAPGRSEDHGRFVQRLLTGIGLGDVPYYGQTLNRCTNLLVALELASALAAAGRHRRILCITTDRVADEAERLSTFALYSDGAAACVVSTEQDGVDAYRLVACGSAQDRATLDGSSQISADLARELNDRLLTPEGLKLGDVSGLMHNNLFKPLVVMKERQAGFAPEQLHLDNITRVGHCFAADPLINLADRAAAGHLSADRHYLLASSVPGARVGALVQKLDR